MGNTKTTYTDIELLRCEEAPTKLSWCHEPGSMSYLDCIHINDQDGKMIATLWSDTAVNTATLICASYNREYKKKQMEEALRLQELDSELKNKI